ncbi:Uncharacterised protein [Ewingella americana]|uniref:Uncharacterized protein n=1 Tax=Ewingella americana TaxID=41202 RepID=A0A377NFZ4_9GAMM|nr:Uncharacterised protein [Ewingella americana]
MEMFAGLEIRIGLIIRLPTTKTFHQISVLDLSNKVKNFLEIFESIIHLSNFYYHDRTF